VTVRHSLMHGFVAAAMLVLLAWAAGWADEAGVAAPDSVGPSPEGRSAAVDYPRGFIPPPFENHHITLGEHRMMAAQSPVRFDWREQGVVTGVKYQGSCGACYAFAGLADFESKILMAGQGEFDFSENNVKECEFFAKNNLYPSGCDGGTYWRIVNLMTEEGTVLETCDPYLPYNSTCRAGCPYIKTLLNWRDFSLGDVPPVATIKAYLVQKGPIFAAIDAGYKTAWKNELNSYDGSYTLYYPEQWPVNHAVLIVGWDDTLSHAGGQGAWICKNSWGTSWGGTAGYGTERGYFTIAYGSANIGQYAAFVEDWQDYDPCGELLLYDEAGYYGDAGFGSQTAWGMCKFVLSEDADLQRVEFWTTDATTDVDIYVYDDFDGNVLSHLLASELNRSYTEMGYHSVPLTSTVHANAGEDVYVAVKFTNASYTRPLAMDPPASTAPSAQGMCYISPNGSTWSLANIGGFFDLGIRLRVHYHRDCEPPDTVSYFRAIPGDGVVSLQWENPDDEDFSHVLIRYSSAGYPMVPQQGSPVENGYDGKFFGDPSAEGTFIHTGRTNNVRYYYSAFAADTGSNYSAPVRVAATPGDAVPPGPVAVFSADGGDRSVILRWTPPDDEDLVGVRIRYSTEAPPLSLEEGLPVENGDLGEFAAWPAAPDSFTHSALVNGTSYYYTIWAFDGMDNISPARTAEAVPVDNVPPEFAVSVLQNPYLTNHLDIYVISSEEIIDTSLVVTLNGAEVDVSPEPGDDRIFRYDYEIYRGGNLEIGACGRDLVLNRGCGSSVFAASRISRESGGDAASADGQLRLTVPAATFDSDVYVVIGESRDRPVSMRALYTVSPASAALSGPIDVSISYGSDVVNPTHLCVAVVEDGKIHPLTSYVDMEKGRVVAHSDRLGAFGLLERADVRTTVRGDGVVAVLPNVPNPFKGFTDIWFAVPEAQPVRVSIFTADGRLVKNLLDSTVWPGRHTVRWDGTNLTGERVAGGIYFVRVSTPTAAGTGKMVMLR
jgi:C1A family cysteine protease